MKPSSGSVIVLIDGEHYPDVTHAALTDIEERGFQVAAIVFLGGTEKLCEPAKFRFREVPLYSAPSQVESLRMALQRHRVKFVIDMSDEPVVGYRERFRLISEALAHGVSYIGSDFTFDAPERPYLCAKPSIGVWGTGKRVGKTALSSYLARRLVGKGVSPCILTMGRGGPSSPEIIHEPLSVTDDYLRARVAEGSHAASDYFEDAMMARVISIGCRRCGGGMAGEPLFSNVREGAEIACKQDSEIVLLEGSGAAIPPVGADSVLLCASAIQPEDYVLSYLGTYRVLLSDLIVVTMCEESLVSTKKLQKLRDGILSINPLVKIVETVFRPRPVGDIRGKRVFLVTSAKEKAASFQAEHLEIECGAKVLGFSHRLADRESLKTDLEDARGADVIVTELKAAGVDTVSLFAKENEQELVYLDNVPVSVGGDLDAELDHLEESSRIRYSERNMKQMPNEP
ncbi:MAG: cyclic 2,3-diphosphoglycerate synthetase [Actinomycetota bacterium]|nr:cyclic 2,3-diphosphoglycerate synthetase [Actinomycetota bacterium]